MKFFFGKVLCDDEMDIIKIDCIGNGNHDDRQKVTIRFEKESLFIPIFNESEAVEITVRVEDISCTHSAPADLDMLELGTTHGQKKEGDRGDHGKSDKEKIIEEKLYGDERSGDEDDRCVPIVRFLLVLMLKCFPFHFPIIVPLGALR